jgi:tetratricopeptide (TPR) repeat protein
MSNKKTNVEYGYYSKLLKEPFDSIEELQEAEEAYYAKQKAKEDAAAQKKADALKVDEAFKALNAARKVYKEEITQLTKEYAESLENLKKAFELGKKDIQGKLAEAEEVYQAALKEFTDKYESYHLTLKDSDFETTIDKQTSNESGSYGIFDILESIFNW